MYNGADRSDCQKVQPPSPPGLQNNHATRRHGRLTLKYKQNTCPLLILHVTLFSRSINEPNLH